MKDIGKPCTGKPYARFDEGEQTTTTTARLMRHRQTKEAETDRPAYRRGRLFPTLPETLVRPFAIDAWVVLPDHLHAVLTLPPGDDDFSTRWRLIKTIFVRNLPVGERLSDVRRRRGERGIWQRRFWEHAIRDDADYAAHLDYVHFNPVKHGHVTQPCQWPYSTFRACANRGLYPLDWTGTGVEDIPAGEPRD